MKKTHALILAIVLVLSIALTVPSALATATPIDSVVALQTAIADDANLVLSTDLSLDATITLDGVDVVLDLGGKTVTTTASTGFKLTNGATLTVKNGTVDATEDAFRVEAGCVLNIEQDATVDAENANCVYIIGEGATLNTAGILNSTSANYAAIQGNGSTGNGGIIINVTGGSITAINEAIYFPNTSQLNISGGTITGSSAVYIKSGALTITGGTLIGNGAKADYVFNNNGCNSTGDAVIIESCNYPGGNPTVSVSGGEFTSTNGKAIGSYNGNEAEAVTGFITGGSFVGAEAIDETLCAEDVTLESDGNGGFVAVEPEFNLPYNDQIVTPNGTMDIIVIDDFSYYTQNNNYTSQSGANYAFDGEKLTLTGSYFYGAGFDSISNNIETLEALYNRSKYFGFKIQNTGANTVSLAFENDGIWNTQLHSGAGIYLVSSDGVVEATTTDYSAVIYRGHHVDIPAGFDGYVFIPFTAFAPVVANPEAPNFSCLVKQIAFAGIGEGTFIIDDLCLATEIPVPADEPTDSGDADVVIFVVVVAVAAIALVVMLSAKKRSSKL